MAPTVFMQETGCGSEQKSHDREIENLKMMHENEIIEGSFGMWITGLWSATCGYNQNLSFLEQKELFFQILEKLLRQRKVMFIKPGADCYISPQTPHPKYTIQDVEARWDAPIEEIMAYVRSSWPTEANHEDDLEIVLYLYDLPGIIWVTDDGKFIGS